MRDLHALPPGARSVRKDSARAGDLTCPWSPPKKRSGLFHVHCADCPPGGRRAWRVGLDRRPRWVTPGRDSCKPTFCALVAGIRLARDRLLVGWSSVWRIFGVAAYFRLDRARGMPHARRSRRRRHRPCGIGGNACPPGHHGKRYPARTAALAGGDSLLFQRGKRRSHHGRRLVYGARRSHRLVRGLVARCAGRSSGFAVLTACRSAGGISPTAITVPRQGTRHNTAQSRTPRSRCKSKGAPRAVQLVGRRVGVH
jgi:hypothetical protein